MKLKGRKVLLCNCERSMALDAKALAGALSGEGDLPIHSNLCRLEVESFARGVKEHDDVIVACTQEAPLFRELADEQSYTGELAFTNIRERAGWCEDKPKATPKIAALLAEAALQIKPTGTRTLTSQGTCLVYGAGQKALDLARLLSAKLNVSLLFTDAGDAVPPAIADVPVYRGRIAGAAGHLGAFEITVDGYAPASPSSRDAFDFLMPRDGARSTCDIIVDLSDGTPLFTGHDKRDGYLRVDADRPGANAEAALAASDLVGEFEKPIYVGYDPSICVHGRNKKIGCSNCLDACPAGAIASAGDTVAIDSAICGGCGSCSANCPTGAVSYSFPQRDDLITRIQTLLGVYLRAGGSDPILLAHDESHGSDLISALARHGRGLPVNVLPLSLYSPGQLGHDALIAGLAAGASRIIVLVDPRRQAEYAALEAQIELTTAFLAGYSFAGADARVSLIAENDPDWLSDLLREDLRIAALKPAAFAPVGGKRDVARAAIGLLRDAAPDAPDIIALPAGAPYGTISIDTVGCTLCLACVSVCPADALLDNPERPEVRFIEQACVQCGLCAKTCPEKVISLTPRYNVSAEARQPQTLHFEEPYHCVKCGKPFGTKSTVERISEKLAGKHSMFQSEAAQQLIRMCDNCRVVAQAEGADNPFAMGERPRVRTTDDYLRAREKAKENGGLSVDDFLLDD